MEALSYEERYLSLRDEHVSLTHKCNEQEDTIRRMNTKLAQIEKNLKLKQQLDGLGVDAVQGRGGPRNREQEQLIEELYRRNGDLTKENTDLKLRNKALADALLKEKKKTERERQARARAVSAGGLSRTPLAAAAATAAPRSTVNSSHVQLGRRLDGDTDAKPGARPRSPVRQAPAAAAAVAAAAAAAARGDVQQVAARLRERVQEAEALLQRLREENQALRAAVNAGSKAQISGALGDVEAGSEVARLQKELRDAQARHQLLAARYEHLEARGRAQGTLHAGSVDRLEETNRQMRDLRRALQDMVHQKDVAEARAARADDLEEASLELRQQNRALEEQITLLCESPFIGKAYAGAEKAARLAELERAERAWQQRAEHLQATAQEHQTALLALQKKAARLRDEKETAEAQLREVRARHGEARVGAQDLADKMRLFGGDEDVDMEELERALTVVRRRADRGAALPFLQSADSEDADSVPVLRRRLQQAQVANLGLTRELERAERMLKAQMGINRDLHLELEERARQMDADKRGIAQKLADFEALALQRLARVQELEAQLRQLRYMGGGGAAPEDGSEAAAEETLLAELADGDFGPDQNVVEVWVVGAQLKEGVIAANASSFVVLDFFDYESQATPLLAGREPRFDFATTYKVTVDDLFLRYLATEGLTLELNQTRAADFDLVARCKVALAPLLSTKPRLVLKGEPLISVRDGAVVGRVHVEIRMALPVSELFQLFLERNPEERGRIAAADAQRRLGGAGPLSAAAKAAAPGEAARLQNEIEVVVEGCQGLPRRAGLDGALPSAYAHYQLLGFQDVFTPVAPPSTAPTWAHACAFPVCADARLLRFLKGYRLSVTVLDDDGTSDDNEDGAGGLIGEAKLSLAALCDGEDITGTLDLEDEAGCKRGTVRVAVRWRRPLRRGGRELGPNALTAVEVDNLMARFSPHKDGQVRWVAFLRYADPPPAVMAALRRLRTFLKAQQDEATTEPFAFLSDVPGGLSPEGLTEEQFIAALMGAPNLDVPPEELAAAFGHLDADCAGRVTRAQLEEFAHGGGRAAEDLRERLRGRMKEVKLRGHFPSAPFETVDGERTGRVTRRQFKQCLRLLGFVLVDEPPQGAPEDTPPADNEDARIRSVQAAGPEEEVLELRWDESARVEADQQRAFKEQVAGIERAVAARVAAAATTAGSLSTPRPQQQQQPSAALALELQAAQAPASPPPHDSTPAYQSSAVEVKDTGARGAASEGRRRHAAATAVQARYRGYRTRRGGGGAEGGGGGDGPERSSSARPADQQGRASILDAEDAIRACAAQLEGVRAFPDLMPAFLALDRAGQGHLDRTKFALALRKVPELALPPLALRAAMDFFDLGASAAAAAATSAAAAAAARIDYAAFCAFCGAAAAPAEAAPAVARLRRMVMSAGASNAFARRDAAGDGVVSRVDLAEALRETGHGRLPPLLLRAVALLFEASSDRVAYASLLQYIAEQGASLEAQALEDELRRHLLSRVNAGQDSAQGVRRAFEAALASGSSGGSGGGGVVSCDEFAAALAQLSFPASQEQAQNVYKRLDPRGAGLDLREFAAFVAAPPARVLPPRAALAAAAEIDAAALRRRAKAAVAEAAQRCGGDLSELTAAFSHYDWRETGRCPVVTFCRALQTAGFPFTRAEGAALAGRFGDGATVAYPQFLAWATPQGDETRELAPAVGGLVGGDLGEVSMAAGGGAAAEVLFKLQRGIEREGLGDADVASAVEDALRSASDGARSGALTQAALLVAMRGLGLALTERDAAALARHARVGDGYGRVRPRALLAALQEDAGQSDHRESASHRIAAALRRAARDLAPDHRRPLRALFQDLSGGLGAVSAAQLARGLAARGGAEFGAGDARAFVRGASGGGEALSYEEFAAAAEGEDPPGDNAGASHLRDRLRDALAAAVLAGTDYRAALEACDAEWRGAVPSADFRGAMRDIGGLSEEEIRLLGEKFAGKGHEVRYVECLRWGRPRGHSSGGGGGSGCGGGGDSDEDAAVEDVAEQLRQAIRRRYDWAEAGGLKRAFRLFDTENTGAFDDEQLEQGLKRLGLRFSILECRQLAWRMDLDNGGGSSRGSGGSGAAVSYPSFVTFVCDANHADVARKVSHGVARPWSEAETRLTRLRRALEREDADGMGVTRAALGQALNGVGVHLTRGELRRLGHRFEAREDGVLSTRSFLKFLGTRSGTAPSESDDDRGSGAETLHKLARAATAAGGLSGLKRALRRRDEGGRGAHVLDQATFRSALEDYGIQLPRADLRAVMSRFASQREGSQGCVRYGDLLLELEAAAESHKVQQGHGRRRQRSTAPSSGSSDSEAGSAHRTAAHRSRSGGRADAAAKPRVHFDVAAGSSGSAPQHAAHEVALPRRGGGAAGARAAARRELQRAFPDGTTAARHCFEEMDDTGLGTLTWSAFRAGLRRLGVRLPEAALLDLAAPLDRDGDGRVDYVAFLAHARRGGDEAYAPDGGSGDGSDYSGSSDQQQAALEQLAQLMTQSGLEAADLLAELQACDLAGSGDLPASELRGALGRLGLRVTLAQAAGAQDGFQGRKAGWLRYGDLCAALADLMPRPKRSGGGGSSAARARGGSGRASSPAPHRRRQERSGSGGGGGGSSGSEEEESRRRHRKRRH